MNDLEQNRISDLFHLAKPNVTINLTDMVTELEKYHMTGKDLVKDVVSMENYLGNLPKDFTSITDAISNIRIETDVLFNDIKQFKKDISLIYADLKSDVDCIKSLVHIPYVDNFTSPINILNKYIGTVKTDISSLTKGINNLENKVVYDISIVTNEISNSLNKYFSDIKKEYTKIDEKFKDALSVMVTYWNQGTFSTGQSAVVSYQCSSIHHALYMMEQVIHQEGFLEGQREAFMVYYNSDGSVTTAIGSNIPNYSIGHNPDFFYVGAIPKDEPDFSFSVIQYRDWVRSLATRMVSHTIAEVMKKLELMFVGEIKDIYGKTIGLADELPKDITTALSVISDYASNLGNEFTKHETNIYKHGNEINQDSNKEIIKIYDSVKSIEKPCQTKVSTAPTSPPPSSTYTVTFNETGVPNTDIWHVQIRDSNNNIIKSSNETIIKGKYVNTYQPIIMNLPAGNYKAISWYSPPNNQKEELQTQTINISIPGQMSYEFKFKTSSSSSGSSTTSPTGKPHMTSVSRISTTSITHPTTYTSTTHPTTTYPETIYHPIETQRLKQDDGKTVENLVDENKANIENGVERATISSLITSSLTDDAVDTAVLSQEDKTKKNK